MGTGATSALRALLRRQPQRLPRNPRHPPGGRNAGGRVEGAEEMELREGMVGGGQEEEALGEEACHFWRRAHPTRARALFSQQVTRQCFLPCSYQGGRGGYDVGANMLTHVRVTYQVAHT